MQENSDFTRNVAKRFCPWCGTPVSYKGRGRPQTFCSVRCRWAFDKYRQRHKEMFEEDNRIESAPGERSETGGIQSPEETEAGR